MEALTSERREYLRISRLAPRCYVAGGGDEALISHFERIDWFPQYNNSTNAFVVVTLAQKTILLHAPPHLPVRQTCRPFILEPNCSYYRLLVTNVQCSSLLKAAMRLISGMLDTADLSQGSDDATEELERMFLFSISWAVGGLLEPDDRSRYTLPRAPRLDRYCRRVSFILLSEVHDVLQL